MPAYIVIVASLVTVVQFMMQAYTPSLSDSLGVYIPLIVVNCIILGRAESYASKNPIVPSIFDGLGMGLGFTLGLTLIGLFRELLGAGQIFGAQVLSLSWFTPITIFVMAPGAFLVLACLVAVMNIVRAKMDAKGKPLAKPSGCITYGCLYLRHRKHLLQTVSCWRAHLKRYPLLRSRSLWMLHGCRSCTRQKSTILCP